MVEREVAVFLTFAREMHKKHMDISIPVIVT